MCGHGAMIFKKLPVGEKVVWLIHQCVQANQPLLLIGSHGIGKSDLFKTAAALLDIGYISRDLSLMEPPDLVGIPFVSEDRRTHFAPPAFLPGADSGLFVIEELNRAPRYMTAPCLQLLTDRVLHDYALPPGWIPMAAINPSGASYHVEALDPALLSRFLQVEVEADPMEWGHWATNIGNVHPKIIQFVQQSPGIFDPGETNPRAWTYLSKQLRTWEANGRDNELLLVAAAGLVGEAWATAFQKFLKNDCAPLTAKAIIDNYPSLRATFRRWTKKGQLDLVQASLRSLKRHLASKRNFESIVEDDTRLKHICRFVDDLPADLSREMRNWLKNKGFEQLS